MAKGDRWSDDPDVKVREMRNAETVLGVIHRPLASRLRSKDSRAVLRGADGKGRSRLPVTAVALWAHEPRHKPIPRQPPTLLHVQFSGGGGGGDVTSLPDQAGLEPPALSASGSERMVYGWVVASEEKRIDFSGGIARFGAILKERDRSSRSGPVRSFPIRLSVSGCSQRGRVCARPEPAGPGVGRGAWDGRMVISGQ